MEKFLEGLTNAEKSIKTADHMVYVTFPLIKDKRLLLKILNEIKNSIIYCIGSILQYEYLYKKITLYKDPRSNFRTFTEKCAFKYEVSKEDILLIEELFDFIEKHNESPFEFVKGDKVVILSNSLKPKTLTLEKVKEFLILAKNLIRKANQKFKRNF
ncbi:hypothetical protein K0A97_00335 [Patescibacteria group bacterium]|nr:hypothetical protein [Patescibacteria group bacterium]